jgi:t-SNARE complex subunit (syntaxin)
MVLAMAEDKKGEAQLLEQQRKGIEMQLEAANEKLKRLIESFDSQTKRLDVQVNAAVADAQIENTRTDTFARQIETTANEIPLRDPYEMSTEELFSELQAG